MEDFITQNISLVNKNNLIILKLGKSLDKNILNCKFNAEQITKFLENISYEVNLSNSSTYDSTEYKFKNYSLHP